MLSTKLKGYKTRLLLVAVGLICLTVGTVNLSFAQTTDTASSSGLVFAAFVVAGIVWSTSGYIANWRNHIEWQKANPTQKDPSWNGFDRAALRDDLFIGLAIGGLAFVTNTTVDVGVITSMASFVAAVIAASGAVALADKFVVGGILNR